MDKFTKKYMAIAKAVALVEPICWSRQIGVLIVDPSRNKIIATGYNGPPEGTPHCDEPEYLKEYLFPLLTTDDKLKLSVSCEGDMDKYVGCKTCPRRLLDIPSGERLELCSCAHAERNAICNAGCDLHGCVAYCYCGIPCVDCTKCLINSGIIRVVCFSDPYLNMEQSVWLFKQSGVEIELVNKDDI